MNEQLLTITDLAHELGIGKASAYALVKSKELPSRKLGSKIIILRTDLDTFIANMTKEN